MWTWCTTSNCTLRSMSYQSNPKAQHYNFEASTFNYPDMHADAEANFINAVLCNGHAIDTNFDGCSSSNSRVSGTMKPHCWKLRSKLPGMFSIALTCDYIYRLAWDPVEPR